MEPLEIGLSPCPNDTFLFYAWQAGITSTLPIKLCYHDVEDLNALALKKRYPITKLSTFNYGKISRDYLILPVGSALGHNCGPKIISKKPFSLSELHTKSIAIPGKHTTANSLLSILCNSPREKMYCVYDEVESILDKDQADCGLIIHETRFTFEESGFYEIADLGEIWQSRTSLPVPLGIYVAKRDIDLRILSQIQTAMELSLKYAWNHPEECSSYMQRYSIDKNLDVIEKHVGLYVNQDTLSISPKAKRAIIKLFEFGEKKGLYSRPLQEPYFLTEHLCPS